MSELPGYLTTAEAAALLGLTVQRVRQLVDALGGVRLGNTLVFPEAKVLAYKALPRPKPGWPKGRSRKEKPATEERPARRKSPAKGRRRSK